MFAAGSVRQFGKAGPHNRKVVGPPASAGIDIAMIGARAGEGFRVEPDLPATTPVLEGSFSLARLREGLFMHCTSIVHLYDMTTRCPTVEPGVKVVLKLEGDAQVSFGGTPLKLDAGQGLCATPCGAVVTLSRPEDFARRCRAGTRERIVVITLTAEWLVASGLDPHRFGPHLAIRDWQPSPRAIGIAEQLLRPGVFDGPTLSLFQESRALELIAEAFAHIHTGVAPSPPGLHPGEYRRIYRLQRLLDSGAADRLDMAAIAQEMGCNANTLQLQFRLAFGQTIFDYLRESRLQRAARALQTQGVNVAQAAEIAGYSSQANFSTAFRRRFGAPPKHFRLKL
jgi:AraC-like DNA-binding protein